MIEIAGLTKHWLTECEAKDKFQECPLCKEAVKKSAFDSHIEEGNCQGGGGAALEHGGTMGESNRCPLCHSNIPAGDEVQISKTVDIRYRVDTREYPSSPSRRCPGWFSLLEEILCIQHAL